MVSARSFAVLTVLAMLPALSSPVCADGMPAAENLHQDGVQVAQTGQPIVLLASAADCPYCEALKDNVFVGMERDERIILRELRIDLPSSLVDFDGNATDHQSFARAHDLWFTPTVMFLDAKGHPLADPLIGVANVDFYLHYLEKAIERSRDLLRE